MKKQYAGPQIGAIDAGFLAWRRRDYKTCICRLTGLPK